MTSALEQLVKSTLSDFQQVATLARTPIGLDTIEVEIRPRPHKPATRLPLGRMAVYAFVHDGHFLKIGKAGPNSHQRYYYQHYNAGSAGSTLAASLCSNPGAAGLSASDIENTGAWIRTNTDRVNLLLPAELGDPVLSLLEAFLHVRWAPIFEGKG